MDWTATALSGWCGMDLHGWADSTIERGYCPLPATKCGCSCHRGGDVRRRTATPQSRQTDTVDEEPEEDEAA